MPTTVQFRRGTTEQNNNFTGAAGEITFETGAGTIRVHDGSTVGGNTVVVLTGHQNLTNKSYSGNTVTLTSTLSVNSGNGVTAIINGGSSGTGNIGATGATFNTVFAKATTAQYADLAEKYTADADYNPGTVVIFGGQQEITVTTVSHDHRIAGVVSTDPAYLMNSEISGLPVALTGRVPCIVQGPVEKGDLLVSSTTPGVAQKLDNLLYRPGCVIGKSLAAIEDAELQTIEVVVGRF